MKNTAHGYCRLEDVCTIWLVVNCHLHPVTWAPNLTNVLAPAQFQAISKHGASKKARHVLVQFFLLQCFIITFLQHDDIILNLKWPMETLFSYGTSSVKLPTLSWRMLVPYGIPSIIISTLLHECYIKVNCQTTATRCHLVTMSGNTYAN